jgi:hypothetical protein
MDKKFSLVSSLYLLGTEGDAIGGGDTNGRGTPHLQLFYGWDHLVEAAAVQVYQPLWQACLVD